MIGAREEPLSHLATGRRIGRGFTRASAFALAASGVGVLVSMMGLFVWTSAPVWRHEGASYLAGTRWFFRAEEFGAAPMVYGTCIVALVALAIAAPIGLGAAIFTSEYLSRPARLFVKAAIELLAGIPSVVYGLLGVLLLRDWVHTALEPFEPLSGDTLLTGGILLALMVLPTVTTLSDDALRSVPRSQRLGARAIGLNQSETILAVVLPSAAPGLVAALLLGLGRALGETIAVFLVVGRQDNQWPSTVLSFRPVISAGQTLTSKLGGSETNLAYGDPLHWAAVVGLGVVLLAMAATVTIVGGWIAERGSAPRA